MLRGRARDAAGTDSNTGAGVGATAGGGPASISGDAEDDDGDDDEMISSGCWLVDDGDDPCMLLAAAVAVAFFFPLLLWLLSAAVAAVGVTEAGVFVDGEAPAAAAAPLTVTLTSPPHCTSPSAVRGSSSPSRHEPTTGVPILCAKADWGLSGGAQHSAGNSGQ